MMNLFIYNAEADGINDYDDDDENNVNLVSIRLVRMEMQVAEEGSGQPGAARNVHKNTVQLNSIQ